MGPQGAVPEWRSDVCMSGVSKRERKYTGTRASRECFPPTWKRTSHRLWKGVFQFHTLIPCYMYMYGVYYDELFNNFVVLCKSTVNNLYVIYFEESPCKIYFNEKSPCHYNDVIMSAMVSYITGISMVCSTVYSGADQRKHQSSTSSTSLAFVKGIHRWQRASNAENLMTSSCTSSC